MVFRPVTHTLPPSSFELTVTTTEPTVTSEMTSEKTCIDWSFGDWLSAKVSLREEVRTSRLSVIAKLRQTMSGPQRSQSLGQSASYPNSLHNSSAHLHSYSPQRLLVPALWRIQHLQQLGVDGPQITHNSRADRLVERALARIPRLEADAAPRRLGRARCTPDTA